MEINNIDQEDNATTVDVNVSCYNPGNQAARLLIGFGAGRGSLEYIAKFIGPDGSLVGEMAAQERFTGMEIGYNQNYGGAATLGGEDVVKGVLIKEAAKHIVEVAIGKKPEEKKIAQQGDHSE